MNKHVFWLALEPVWPSRQALRSIKQILKLSFFWVTHTVYINDFDLSLTVDSQGIPCLQRSIGPLALFVGSQFPVVIIVSPVYAPNLVDDQKISWFRRHITRELLLDDFHWEVSQEILFIHCEYLQEFKYFLSLKPPELQLVFHLHVQLLKFELAAIVKSKQLLDVLLPFKIHLEHICLELLKAPSTLIIIRTVLLFF